MSPSAHPGPPDRDPKPQTPVRHRSSAIPRPPRPGPKPQTPVRPRSSAIPRPPRPGPKPQTLVRPRSSAIARSRRPGPKPQTPVRPRSSATPRPPRPGPKPQTPVRHRSSAHPSGHAGHIAATELERTDLPTVEDMSAALLCQHCGAPRQPNVTGRCRFCRYVAPPAGAGADGPARQLRRGRTSTTPPATGSSFRSALTPRSALTYRPLTSRPLPRSAS